jgi:large subunit ribosomal protein L18
VFRSVAHIYAQVIDDTKGTRWWRQLDEKDAREQKRRQCGGAKEIGKLVAERAKEKGITKWCSTAAAICITAA